VSYQQKIIGVSKTCNSLSLAALVQDRILQLQRAMHSLYTCHRVHPDHPPSLMRSLTSVFESVIL